MQGDVRPWAARPGMPAFRDDQQFGGHQREVMIALMPVCACTQVHLGQGGQAMPGERVQHGSQLDSIAHRDAQRLHQAAPGRPLARQWLDHAGQFGPPQAQQGTGHQFGHPATLGRGGTVVFGLDARVEALDQEHIRVVQQRADQARDEMRAPAGEVGVHEHQQVAFGDQERLPQRLALARVGAEMGRDVAGPVHRGAGPGGHGGGRIGRIGVHHHDLVDQRRVEDQGLADRGHHPGDGLLLVAGGDDHADPQALPPFGGQQLVCRPVPPVRGPLPEPRAGAVLHGQHPSPVQRELTCPHDRMLPGATAHPPEPPSAPARVA